MATNFSINARRIRDLQEVTTIGDQFVPAASYVLVDAADANNMYTSYKMKVSALSDAISGMVGDDTIQRIRTDFNTISSEIKTTVTNAVVAEIVTDDFKNTIKTNVATKLVDDGISSSIADALIDQGIATDVITDLETNGIALSVADKLSSDSTFTTTVISDFKDALVNNTDFIQRITMALSESSTFNANLANLISASSSFTTAIVAPISAALTADTTFIDAIKDLVNNE